MTTITTKDLHYQLYLDVLDMLKEKGYENEEGDSRVVMVTSGFEGDNNVETGFKIELYYVDDNKS